MDVKIAFIYGDSKEVVLKQPGCLSSNDGDHSDCKLKNDNKFDLNQCLRNE